MANVGHPTIEDRELQLPPLQTWTQAQRDYWEQYVADMADELRLGHIEVFFEWGKSLDKGCTARSTPQLERNRLRTGWSEDLPKDAPEEQRDTAVHELVHYHLARLRQVLLAVEDHVQKDAFLTLVKVIDVDEEQLCDTLTRLLAPHLPLPAWPAEDSGAGGVPTV